MRWFFLFVLALNLSYISWHLLGDAEPYADVPPLKKDIERIVLLSETGSADAKQATASVTESPEAEPDQQQETGQQVADIVAAPAAVKQAEPVAEKKPVESVRAEPQQEDREIEFVGTQHAMGPKGEENCYTLGPFRDLEALRSLTRDIKSYVVSADFRGEEVSVQSTYWVFIRPAKTQDQARELAARLKASKINDFYIIRKGDQQNGISLGRFRNKASAYGLAKKVSKLGFDVAVEPIFKNETHYWLDYQLSENANIPKAVFDKYIDGEDEDFTRKSRVCS